MKLPKCLLNLYTNVYTRGHRFLYGVRKEHVAYDLPYFISKKKSKEKYVIFRYSMPTYMIYAAGRNYVFAYEWAKRHHMIPLIDLEYEYAYECFDVGRDNLWDYFFEQALPVKEAVKKDWVLVESLNSRRLSFNPFGRIYNGKKDDYTIRIREKNWRDYYSKLNSVVSNSWKLNDRMQAECERLCNEKIGTGEKVVGVLLREQMSVDANKNRINDAAKTVYNKHPQYVGINDTIELLKEYIDKWGGTRIFLSTMVQDSVDLFVEQFGDMVTYIDRNRARNGLVKLHKTDQRWAANNMEIYEDIKNSHKEDLDRKNSDGYIKEIYILSNCEYLFAPKCGGTIAALTMNGGKYSDFYCLPDLNNSKLY